MATKYRIEVYGNEETGFTYTPQKKYRWWPFWLSFSCGGYDISFSKLADAEEYIEHIKAASKRRMQTDYITYDPEQ